MVADEISAKDAPTGDEIPTGDEPLKEDDVSTEDVSTGDEIPTGEGVSTGGEFPVENGVRGVDESDSTISLTNQQLPDDKKGVQNKEKNKGTTSVVSPKVLQDWSDTEGHESEDKFFEILTDPKKFNLRKLEPGETPPADESIPNGTVFVSRMPIEKDWEGEGDFILWIKTRNGPEPIPVDLSTADPRKPENERHIRKKLDAEENGGPLYLYLPKWVIDQGRLGGEVALDVISQRMEEVLKKAVERRKRAKLQSRQ